MHLLKFSTIPLNICSSLICTVWKVSEFGVFLFCSHIQTEYKVNLNIQPNCEKIRTRETPNSDNFYAVLFLVLLLLLLFFCTRVRYENLGCLGIIRAMKKWERFCCIFFSCKIQANSKTIALTSQLVDFSPFSFWKKTTKKQMITLTRNLVVLRLPSLIFLKF